MSTKPTLDELLVEINKMRDHVQWLEEAGHVLQSQEDVYREMVHSANSIILAWNKEGRISFINRFALQFFGFEEREIIGRSVLETIVPETDAKGINLKALMKDICKHPEKYVSNENENIRKNGERVWIAWTNKPIFNRQGDFLEILSVGNDITRRKKAEDELEKLASTDMLTGALNRRAGMEILENGLKLAKRKKYHLTICFVDVNNLKMVNDTIGHDEGDGMIKTVSSTLAASLRASDVLVRLGGDEFLVILPECSLQVAEKLWKRFQQALDKKNKAGGRSYQLSVSHGFAEYAPDQPIPNLRDFITLADERMYECKKAFKKKAGAS